MKKLVSSLMTVILLSAALGGCAAKETLTSQTDKDTQTKVEESKKDEGKKKEVAKEEEESNFNPTGYPIVNEPITLKVMGAKAAIHGPWEEMKLFEEMEGLTNIKIEFTTHPVESYQELKNLAFVSGDYPDMFYAGNLSPADEVMYGKQGTLQPLNNLIDEYAPNLLKLMEADKELRKNITTADGNIYTLPMVNDVIWDQTQKVWINEEWIANVGMEMPETVDDLYNLLKAFKTQDPNGNGKQDEIPLSFDDLTGYGVKAGVLAAFGLIEDGSNVQVKDDKAIFIPTTDEYKEYLMFMNKLYAEQLLDNECFTQTNQQMVAKGNEMRIGMFSHAGSFLVAPYDKKEIYPALAPMTSSVNDEKMWPKFNSITRGTFAITDKNEHPEATMRWVDYFYSLEGGMMMGEGPEGYGWEWTDDSKSEWKKIEHEGFANTEEFRGGKVTPNCGVPTPGFVSSEFKGKLSSEHVPILYNEVKDKYQPYWQVGFPLVYYTEEQQKELTTLQTDIKSYTEQMHAKFITGEVPFSEWDKYVATVEKMKVAEYLSIHQVAYNAWNQ